MLHDTPQWSIFSETLFYYTRSPDLTIENKVAEKRLHFLSYMLLASIEPKMQNFLQASMERTFILHSCKTNEDICVGWENFRSEGTCDESGTMVWWTDENGTNHSAMVKETPEEVNQIMQKSLTRQ